MSAQERGTRLPQDIDHYLGLLSKLYGRELQTRKLEVIVNAQVRVQQGWDYDNWDGGVYGHALFLTIPENIYLLYSRDRDNIQDQIRDDLNKIHNVQDEHISAVFIEVERSENAEWRRESGLLQTRQRSVSTQAASRIWDDGYRVFLSHKAEVKKKVAQVKGALNPFGITAFVAHEDIHPTKVWQDEIENALATMDAFVAVLTENFHDSDWTDQEVGYALARGVPIIAVKLGLDPYGFIGRFQALSCDWDEAPLEIARLLINDGKMLNAFVAALPRCRSFDEANGLARFLKSITAFSEDQAEQLIEAFNSNSQLKGSYGFAGTNGKYGEGIIAFLKRTRGLNIELDDFGKANMIEKSNRGRQ